MTDVDIREMVPRVRRSLEGAGSTPSLTDGAIKDIVADSCADVILYTGSLFGLTLTATSRDPVSNAPEEYATSAELTLAQQSVVAAQAALNYFFFLFAGLKVQEKISDEGSAWEYQLSANLLVEQLKMLQRARDAAIDAIKEQDPGTFDTYTSFLAIRDRETSRLIEPWAVQQLGSYGANGGGYGGQDFRFGGY